jgi:hypothetical protein
MQTAMSSHYRIVENTSSLKMSLAEVSDRQTPANDVEIPVQGFWVAPAVLIALAGIAVTLKRSLTGKVTHNYTSAPKSSPKLPCSNCRFFGSNPYLKCAVHPSKALKSEAMNCSDYWSQDSDRFSQ